MTYTVVAFVTDPWDVRYDREEQYSIEAPDAKKAAEIAHEENSGINILSISPSK